MVSTAFKVELIEGEIPSTGPYISFIGKFILNPNKMTMIVYLELM
jgi:hypothetical protein